MVKAAARAEGVMAMVAAATGEGGGGRYETDLRWCTAPGQHIRPKSVDAISDPTRSVFRNLGEW